jgi:FeS assembly protein IscX
LYWENSFEIVHALMDAHPDTDVSSIGLEALYQMVIELPDFADDPALVNDGILKDILREWYEESDQDGI